jgi:aryl-alcohol dehydrogenase-like predicted oxidoreductase
MEQPQYNMFHRDRVEREYLPLYREIGLGATTWSPLASGLLSGKYGADAFPQGTRASLPGYDWIREGIMTPEGLEKVRQLQPIAGELGCTLAQLAIAWCRSNQNVSTVITGATSPAQVEENMKSLEFVPKLDPGVVQRIEAVLGNRPRPEEP